MEDYYYFEDEKIGKFLTRQKYIHKKSQLPLYPEAGFVNLIKNYSPTGLTVNDLRTQVQTEARD
jgi:patatin-like phospholipase/acyl hydrolase